MIARHEVNTVIRMSVEEANWLKQLTEKPLYDDETSTEKRMRESFHKALTCITHWPTIVEDDIPF